MWRHVSIHPLPPLVSLCHKNATPSPSLHDVIYEWSLKGYRDDYALKLSPDVSIRIVTFSTLVIPCAASMEGRTLLSPSAQNLSVGTPSRMMSAKSVGFLKAQIVRMYRRFSIRSRCSLRLVSQLSRHWISDGWYVDFESCYNNNFLYNFFIKRFSHSLIAKERTRSYTHFI